MNNQILMEVVSNLQLVPSSTCWLQTCPQKLDLSSSRFVNVMKSKKSLFLGKRTLAERGSDPSRRSAVCGTSGSGVKEASCHLLL